MAGPGGPENTLRSSRALDSPSVLLIRLASLARPSQVLVSLVLGTSQRSRRLGNGPLVVTHTAMAPSRFPVLDDVLQPNNSTHTEGPVAKTIEQQTAKLPSDWFLWAAVGSIATSLTRVAPGPNPQGAAVGLDDCVRALRYVLAVTVPTPGQHVS